MIPSDIIRPRSIVRLSATTKPALFRALAKKAAAFVKSGAAN